MRPLNLSKIPIANKNIDEYRKCNTKKILQLEFKDNTYKIEDITRYNFLKNKDINLLFFVNEKIVYKNFIDNINYENDDVIISKNCNKPLVVVNYYSDSNTLFEKNIKYIIDTDSCMSIMEIYESNGSENYISENREFSIDKVSSVEYIKLQNLSHNDFFSNNFKQNIHDESDLTIFSFDYGSSNSYSIFDTNLIFPNTKFNFEAIVNIKKSQEVANIIKTQHNAKHTKSSVNAKHICDDNSHAIYEAKSCVNENGKYSDVHQNSQSTLLSDDAKINANPRMEIYIDELTASHGATTGSLDDEILYYLQSRGLSRSSASKILLEAIKNRVFDKIKNNEIKEIYKNLVKE